MTDLPATQERARYRRKYSEAGSSRFGKVAIRYNYADGLKVDAGCLFCGYKGNPAALSFHHVNESEKAESVARLTRTGKLDSLKREIKKCVIICANCHFELHHPATEEQKCLTYLTSTNTTGPRSPDTTS